MEKVDAAKMEAHAGMMKVMNEASDIKVSKMSQEAKIIIADISGMDPLTMASYNMYRERNNKEVLAAQINVGIGDHGCIGIHGGIDKHDDNNNTGDR
jgi:hypothetical protein